MLTKRQQNKIKTPGYFIKRLRDSGIAVLRIFQHYGEHDPRRWTVLVDPSKASIFVTCYTNKNQLDEVMFEFNDGGNLFPKNYNICTQSAEVIVQHLIERGVQPIDKGGIYYAEAKV